MFFPDLDQKPYVRHNQGVLISSVFKWVAPSRFSYTRFFEFIMLSAVVHCIVFKWGTCLRAASRIASPAASAPSMRACNTRRRKNSTHPACRISSLLKKGTPVLPFIWISVFSFIARWGLKRRNVKTNPSFRSLSCFTLQINIERGLRMLAQKLYFYMV